jgi:hypothetical protein
LVSFSSKESSLVGEVEAKLNLWPQCPQNLSLRCTSAAHWGQAADSAAPHSRQNLFTSGFWVWQLWHSMLKSNIDGGKKYAVSYVLLGPIAVKIFKYA